MRRVRGLQARAQGFGRTIPPALRGRSLCRCLGWYFSPCQLSLCQELIPQKIHVFQAHNVILRVLEGRLAHEVAAVGAQGTPSRSVLPVTANAQHRDLTRLRHLVETARNKCDVKARQVMDIVQTHVCTECVEWDDNRVLDGTYYAAQILAREGGTVEEVATCLQAINQSRWAFPRVLSAATGKWPWPFVFVSAQPRADAQASARRGLKRVRVPFPVRTITCEM